VYAGILEGNTTALWIRRLNELNATRLPDTEDASLPFWSPDSRSLAFFAGGKLKKIDPSGGPAQTICDAGFFLGGTWSREGVILLGGSNRPISRVPPAGDAVQPLLKLDAAHKETSQGWPHFLPDGRHFVYTSTSVESGKVGIYVASLDSSQPRLLIENAASATYVFPGLLVFGRGRSLMAQAFDAAKLELSGEPFPVVDQVDNTRSSFAYSASSNGVLVYQHNQSAVTGSQPVWYNREGKRLSAAGEPRLYTQGSLSPDEKRFAAQIRDPNTRINDLWTLELASGILSRITSGTASKNTVYWSPDGREVLFSSSKSGVMNLFRKPAGGGDDRLVQASAKSIYPLGWLSDGSITFRSDNSFLRLSPSPGAKPETLFKSDHSIDELRVSPDGRWATYNSNETGRNEVYIVAFPSFTERRQVSNNGGAQGYWRKDGKELFYLSLNGNLVSVPLKPGPTLEPGIPKILFPTRLTVEPLYDQFAATGDGQRFLVIEPVETAATPFTIVLNWPAGLKK
jgi:Tol biopolymer transport system component